jgi:hypothetical protein
LPLSCWAIHILFFGILAHSAWLEFWSKLAWSTGCLLKPFTKLFVVNPLTYGFLKFLSTQWFF